MNLNNNGLLRLSVIGALALGAAPAVPSMALADGGGANRCAGAAILGVARVEAGGDIHFAGYVQVNGSGKFSWICANGASVVERDIDCGDHGEPYRLVHAALRHGVLYFDCV